MPSQEFAAVIAIESPDSKRQGFLNGLDLLHHAIRTLVPGCPAFGPSGAGIGHGQTPHEVARQAVAAMRHCVGLHEAGLCNIPYSRLNRLKLYEMVRFQLYEFTSSQS